MIPGIVAQAATSQTAFTPADFMADTPSLLLSMRLLNPSYSGDCLRVRRSLDNTEQDIGFDGDELDTAALLTFCGAGSGYIVTWYDQSGNGNNFTQATSGNQPRIVNSGVLDTFGGKPAIWLTNGSTYLTSTTFHFLETAQTVIFSAKRDSSMASNYTGFIGTQRSSRMGLGLSNGGYQNIQQLGRNDKSFVDPRMGNANGINSRWSVYGWATRWGRLSNGVIDVTGTLDGNHGVCMAMGGMGGSPSTSYIGSNAQTGHFHEMVAYPSFLPTENRKSLEHDMCVRVGATFQLPYFVPSDPYGVADLDQVFALRKLVPEYNGPCITIWNGSVQANIGFDSFGDLDLTELATYNTGSNDIIIQVWHNQLGNGNSLGNDQNGARIVIAGTLQTIDGTHPAVVFDNDRGLNSGWGVMGQPYTYACTFKSTTTNYRCLFSQVLYSAQMGIGMQATDGQQAYMCNGVTHSVNGTACATNTVYVATYRAATGFTTGSHTIRPTLNGPDQPTLTTNFGTRTGWRNHIRHGDNTINNADYFVGPVAEIVMVERELDSTDRYAIQNSMGARFGVTIT